MTGLKEQQLFESFENKEYRDAFVEEHISSGLAFQIRALRERNGWTQEELGQRTGKAQETISQLESHDYGRFTMKTLKMIASAFDVALEVRFLSFGDLITRLINLSPETIAPPSYEAERQMSFAEVPGGSSEWNVSLEVVKYAPVGGFGLHGGASTLFVPWLPYATISAEVVDSTGDILVKPTVSKPEVGKEKREFALAA